jgi:hypothetical protein
LTTRATGVSFQLLEERLSLFDEHQIFAMIIKSLIIDDWNWSEELKRLKQIRIYKKHDNVSKILSLIEDIKKKFGS